MKVPAPAPFRSGNSRGSMQRNGSIEDGGLSGSRLNNEYYASGARGGAFNDRASSSESDKYGSQRGHHVSNI